jgi:hypothetical protein
MLRLCSLLRQELVALSRLGFDIDVVGFTPRRVSATPHPARVNFDLGVVWWGDWDRVFGCRCSSPLLHAMTSGYQVTTKRACYGTGAYKPYFHDQSPISVGLAKEHAPQKEHALQVTAAISRA